MCFIKRIVATHSHDLRVDLLLLYGLLFCHRYISVDEQALIDLPAGINYILDKTGAKKLSLLTHSQV